VAKELGDAYEIHFWGGVSLTKPRLEEYIALRSAGYPLVFRNFDAAIELGILTATPSQYLVTHQVQFDASLPLSSQESGPRADARG
jgi:hypothetical protein